MEGEPTDGGVRTVGDPARIGFAIYVLLARLSAAEEVDPPGIMLVAEETGGEEDRPR